MKISLSDRPAVAAYFDRDDGGTIGRAPANHLVLQGFADISQVHAAIERINGKWLVKDLGDLLPVVHNGRALGYGRRADLGDGDELRIGEAVLEVDLQAVETAVPAPAVVVAAAVPVTRLPDDFDPLQPAATPAPIAAPVPVPAPAPTYIPADFDPLAPPPAATAGHDRRYSDDFDALTSTAPFSTPSPAPAPAYIPTDFDPLAPPPAKPADDFNLLGTPTPTPTLPSDFDPFAPVPAPASNNVLPANFDPFAPAQAPAPTPAQPVSTEAVKKTLPDDYDPFASIAPTPAPAATAPTQAASDAAASPDAAKKTLPDDYDPFASIAPTPAPAATAPTQAASDTVASPDTSPKTLPDDYDPFAGLAPTPAPSAPTQAASDAAASPDAPAKAAEAIQVPAPAAVIQTPAPLPDDFDPLAGANHGISLEDFAASAPPTPAAPPPNPKGATPLNFAPTPAQADPFKPGGATDPFAAGATPSPAPRSPQVDPFSLFTSPAPAPAPQATAPAPAPVAAPTPAPTPAAVITPMPAPAPFIPEDFDPLAPLEPTPAPKPKVADPFDDPFAFRIPPPPPPPPQSAYHALMEAAATKPISSSPPPSAAALAALQQDPFSAKPAPMSPSNRVDLDPLGLETNNLLNPMHHRDNLDPTRHKSESIDDLFGLGGGSFDPLAPGGVFNTGDDAIASDSSALDLLGPKKPAQHTTRSDHTPGIHSTMSIITASGQAAQQQAAQQQAEQAPIPAPTPAPAKKQDSLDDLFGLGDGSSNKPPF